MFVHWRHIFLFLALGCGVEVGNPRNPTDDDKSTKFPVDPETIVTQDSEAAFHIVAGQIDEVIDGVAADDSTVGGGSLFLIDLSNDKSCETDGDNAVVTRKVSGAWEAERGVLPRNKKVYSASVDIDKTVTWSSDSAAITCNNAGTNAKIAWRDVEDISRSVKLSRSKTATITRKIDGTLLRKTQFSSEGTRSFSWLRAESDDDSLRKVSGTFATDVTRTQELTTARNGEFESEETVKTADDAPLVIEAFYDADSGDLGKKVIKSGQVVATQKDGAVVKTSYTDVVLQPSSGCQPISGNLSGEIFENDSIDTPSITYAVVFSDTGALATFSTGEVEEYEVDGCQFEE